MKLGFDFDGVITDGQYFDLSRIPEDVDRLALYNTLGPYDSDTLRIWNQLCEEHDCYIVTARGSGKQHSFKHSLQSVLAWVTDHDILLPRGIFTAVNKSDKIHLLESIHVDMYVDDSPDIFKHYNETFFTQCLLMNNPGFEDNQNAKLPLVPRISSWKELQKYIESKVVVDACLATR